MSSSNPNWFATANGNRLRCTNKQRPVAAPGLAMPRPCHRLDGLKLGYLHSYHERFSGYSERNGLSCSKMSKVSICYSAGPRNIQGAIEKIRSLSIPRSSRRLLRPPQPPSIAATYPLRTAAAAESGTPKYNTYQDGSISLSHRP